MASKQLSKFEKDQIVTYNNFEQSLCNIAKKLNHQHSSIDVFLKNKKTGDYHQKGHGHKRKQLHLKIQILLEKQHTATSQQLKDEMKLNVSPKII